MRRITIGLLVLLLVGVPASAQAQAVLQGTAAPDAAQVAPGTSGRIVLDLKNIGNASIYRMDARVSSVDAGIEAAGDVDIGGLAAGASTTVSPFGFTVPSETRPGTYNVRVAVTYQWNTGSGTAATSLTMSATVKVVAPATLLVDSVQPHRLVPGAQTMTLVLANHGTGAFSNVLGSWTSENDAILPLGSGNTFYVSSIGAGNSTQVVMDVAVRPSAPPGLYALTVQLSYRDEGGTEISTSSTVGVQVATSGAQVEVSVQQAGASQITLAAANVGSSPVTAVQLRYVPGPDQQLLGRDTAVLGNLEAGAFLTATFDVSGTGQGNVEVAYTESTGERVRVSQPLFATGGDAGTIGVTIQDMDSDMVTLAITNKGLAALTGVQITLQSLGGFSVTNADTLALGSLEPGAFAPAEFEISKGAGDFVATAVLEYTDADGSRRSESHTVTRAAPEANGAATPVLALGLVAALAVAGGTLWWRKRHKQQAEAEAAEEEWAQLEPKEPGWEPPK